MAQLKRALVGVSTIVDPQLQHHKKIAKYLFRMSDVHNTSPVYHYKSSEEEGLSVVYSLRTQLSPDELLKRLIEIERSTRSPQVKVCLLVIDDIIARKPDLILPYNELHTQKKWCLPASDIWGDYVHPIERKELKMLLELTGSEEKIEFYAQSKSLLDFLSLET